jgi:hypothetical protein
VSALQGLDVSRQVPGLRSHRPVRASQIVEQQVMPPSWPQPSPVGRHTAGVETHRLPMQSAEQHWLSSMQDPPAVMQSGPPHIPPLHPSEQHWLGSLHRAPSAWQYCEHERAPVRPAGSQRSLQQVPRVLHAMPGAEHVPEGRQ